MIWTPKRIKLFLEDVLGYFFYGVVIIFCLFFWYNNGWHISGDIYEFGFKEPKLGVVFPYIGLCFLFLLGIQFVLLKFRVRQSVRRFYWWLFLATLCVNIWFSFMPEISMYWLLVWVLALLMTFVSSVSLKKDWIWACFGIGIFLGLVFHFLLKDGSVSLSLLGIALLCWFWAGLSVLKKHYQFVFLLTISFLVSYLVKDVWIFIVLSVFSFYSLWFCHTKMLRFPRNFKWGIGGLWTVFVSFGIFWYGSQFLGFLERDFPIYFDVHWFSGIGMRDFLLAQQEFSSSVLLPSDFKWPTFGWELLWYEMGLLGFLSIGILVMLVFAAQEKDNALKITLFLMLSLLIPEFLFTENGLLLLGFVFLPRGKSH